jgi:serine/threonine protein kinase
MMLERSQVVIGKGGSAVVYLGRLSCRSDQAFDEHPTAMSSSSMSVDDLTASPFTAASGSHRKHRLVAVKKRFVRQCGGDASPVPLGDEEHSLMQRIAPHPHVMQVLATASCDGHTQFALELMCSDLQHELGGSRVTERQAQEVMRSVLGALAHVHGHGIVHRDVKLGNVLVRSDPADPDNDGVTTSSPLGCRIALGDFGVAHSFEHDQQLRDAAPPSVTARPAVAYRGTRYYQPPEAFLGRMVFDDVDKCDSWAAGCMLYELLAGHPAFVEASGLGMLHVILDRLGSTFGDYPKQVAPATLLSMVPSYASKSQSQCAFAAVSPECADLISQLLALDPSKRLSVRDAVHHPFLQPTHLAEQQCDALRLRRDNNVRMAERATSVQFFALQSSAPGCAELTIHSDFDTSDHSVVTSTAKSTSRNYVAQSHHSQSGTLHLQRGSGTADGSRVTLSNMRTNALFGSASTGMRSSLCGGESPVVMSVVHRSVGSNRSGGSLHGVNQQLCFDGESDDEDHVRTA